MVQKYVQIFACANLRTKVSLYEQNVKLGYFIQIKLPKETFKQHEEITAEPKCARCSYYRPRLGLALNIFAEFADDVAFFALGARHDCFLA